MRKPYYSNDHPEVKGNHTYAIANVGLISKDRTIFYNHFILVLL